MSSGSETVGSLFCLSHGFPDVLHAGRVARAGSRVDLGSNDLVRQSSAKQPTLDEVPWSIKPGLRQIYDHRAAMTPESPWHSLWQRHAKEHAGPKFRPSAARGSVAASAAKPVRRNTNAHGLGICRPSRPTAKRRGEYDMHA